MLRIGDTAAQLLQAIGCTYRYVHAWAGMESLCCGYVFGDASSPVVGRKCTQ